MKKIFFILVTLINSVLSIAQSDSIGGKFLQLHRVYANLNFMTGVMAQSFSTVDLQGSYSNFIPDSTNISSPNFKSKSSTGFGLEVSYFFDKKCHFGEGIGLVYLSQSYQLVTDNFNVQYRSVDDSGYTFRKIIKSKTPVTEKINCTNINLPLMLKFQQGLTSKIGVDVDLGIVVNMSFSSSFSSDASFDYDAAYHFRNGSFVYDNNSAISSNDFVISKAYYIYKAQNPNSTETMEQYFADKYNHGFNVAINKQPDNNSGSVNTKSSGIGMIGQLTLFYQLNNRVAISLGGYYIGQSFNNDYKSDYRMTDKVGEYSSVTNAIKQTSNKSYGMNIGVKLNLGK